MTINKKLLMSIPDKIGVYIFKDQENNVLYVGKALSLKNRVSNYFIPETLALKERQIKEKTVNIDFLITKNEAEALILENNLIKQYSPPYNIRFKDDKSYPLLKITMQDGYPAIYITRELVEDGSRYFGPYASAWGIRRVARYAQRLFG
ncbi:excinuclease ABC subunit C, partial [Candidatus Bathyarchaeota archaeon]